MPAIGYPELSSVHNVVRISVSDERLEIYISDHYFVGQSVAIF